MNRMPGCERESEVRNAMRESLWTDELRAHAAVCPSCAEEMLVAAAFAVADLPTDHRPLPNAAIVWWKAAARRKQQVAERATRPIRILDMVSAIVAAAAAALLTAHLAGASRTTSIWAACAGLLLAVGIGISTLRHSGIT
jgi:hypothetical protein